MKRKTKVFAIIAAVMATLLLIKFGVNFYETKRKKYYTV